jgi:MFS transporter, YNFM family, putative membrane transport protein
MVARMSAPPKRAISGAAGPGYRTPIMRKNAVGGAHPGYNSQPSAMRQPLQPVPPTTHQAAHQATQKTPTRAIVLLAVAGFASQAQVRVTDSLLPQIAADFDTTVGAAAVVVTAYALAHGSSQLLTGPVGDRFGKYRTITLMALVSAILVVACGFAQSLSGLALARLLAGATAGWIIPLSMAYVGDVTPYERRQPVLGRYLSGQIFGQLFGQAMGGILGDLFGWRNVFVVLGGLFALAAAGLIFELWSNPQTRTPSRPEETSRGFVADYKVVLSNGWARIVILAVLIEAAVGWGAFAYVGAHLNQRFGLGYSAVGLIVGAFGVGGLIYAGAVQQLVDRLGQRGLAIGGGVLCGIAYVILAIETGPGLAPLAVVMIGLGFYALHNTLQTNATQMTPQARGTAVSIFSSVIYLGQTAGVAAGAMVFDRHGALPLFATAALVLPALAIWFARRLQREQSRDRR